MFLRSLKHVARWLTNKTLVFHPFAYYKNTLFVPFYYSSTSISRLWSDSTGFARHVRSSIFQQSRGTVARWTTSQKWIEPERVEPRRHIILPEDASARSSHLCLLLRVDVPICTKQVLSLLGWTCPPSSQNIIKCKGQGEVGGCVGSVHHWHIWRHKWSQRG